MNRAMVDDTMYINTEEKLIAGISLLLKTQGGLKERLQKAYSDEFSGITNIPEKFSDKFKNFISDMENLEQLTEEEICAAMDNIFEITDDIRKSCMKKCI